MVHSAKVSSLVMKLLGLNDLEGIVRLLTQLNPEIHVEVLQQRTIDMLKSSHYNCFGFYQEDQIIGLVGCWTSIRIYSGKQLELDNVIIDKSVRAVGYGSQMLDRLEKWAISQEYESIELNTYVENSGSHKFYFKQGFKILGFHFQKILELKNN